MTDPLNNAPQAEFDQDEDGWHAIIYAPNGPAIAGAGPFETIDDARHWAFVMIEELEG